MSKQLLAQIEAELNVGVHEGEVHGCWVPREAIERVPDFWRLADASSYCPATFDASVPDELCKQKPIVVDGSYAYVFGYNGEFAFYFKLVCTLHVPHQHPSLAHAIGAFVQGELAACMRRPKAMQGPDDPAIDAFDFFKFEAHLRGLLSDLVYCCAYDGTDLMDETYVGPVVLVIVAAAPEGQSWPDQLHEWQKCAQGFARIETVREA